MAWTAPSLPVPVPLQPIDPEIQKQVDKFPVMHGILIHAEEVGGTGTVRRTEARYGPVGDLRNGCRDLALDVVGSPYGKAGNPLRMLPEMIDVPVELLCLAAVSFEPLGKVLCGRAD